jgi:hypothetical protein
MNDFQSYSSYVPPEEAYTQTPSIRQDAPVHRVNTSDGAMTEKSDNLERGHSGQINPASGTNTWQATATTTTGRAVSEITADSLVSINGLQGKVSFFVGEGILQKNSDGTFSEGEGKPQQEVEETGDILAFDDDAIADMNQALEGVPAQYTDILAATATGVALGRIDHAQLIAKFGTSSGLDPATSRARIAILQNGYQTQADQALESRAGLGAEDRAEFYQWAKANHNAQLQDAIGRQMRSSDVSGYTALAEKWMNTTPPSMNALKAAGIPIRGSECFIRGQWMTPSAAARAGLI